MTVLSLEPGAHQSNGLLIEHGSKNPHTTLDRLSSPMTWCTYIFCVNPLTFYDRFFHYLKPIMAGAQFEYDEKGTTFYYFLISFYGIVLVPVTYYVWNVTKLPGELNLSPVVHKTTINSFRRESQLFIPIERLLAFLVWFFVKSLFRW